MREALSVLYDPLLPWPVLAGLGALALAFLALAARRGLAGWPLRALSLMVLLLALANPVLQKEEREALSDIVVVIVDESASQKIADRADQTEAALATLAARIRAHQGTELRIIRVGDGEEDSGTRLMRALTGALADVPRSRLAGVLLLTDGRVHDAALAPDLPAPLHVLLTGREGDWDRRLIVKNAPAFAILGEEVVLTLRIEDEGTPPAPVSRVPITISIDGGEAQHFRVPVGKDLELPIVLPHGGINVIRFATAEAEGELTGRNNAAVVQINGVRDRLRVLLVSGEPYPGERTWRNLLKSDSSVDLVHFTILRPPEKQDGVPVNELSLIAFPVRELFMEKIDDFDLIIFDRYRLRGILPGIYLDNIRRYVEKGGAVLVAAGPEFAGAESIYYSALADILPADPTARVIERGYRPRVTDIGRRHPVTEGLEALARKARAGGDGADGAGSTADAPPPWGRWLRQIELQARGGDVVMAGIGDRPLLLLDHAGEGRVALLASDQAWLWARGFEGGGPQLELLRRLAHWLMKEPELEEEALFAAAQGQNMRITRRTLGESVPDVEITAPDGSTATLRLEKVAPGRFEGEYTGAEMGLYRLSDGIREAVVALGPAAPREFEATLATGEILAPAVAATRGGIFRIEEGVPLVRTAGEGRRAAGRGWLAITPRNAYLSTDITRIPLLPAWLAVLLAGALMIGAWLREGGRAAQSGTAGGS